MLLRQDLCCLPAQAKEAWDLSSEEKVALARKRKEHGNALFKAAKWARAIAKYKSAAEAVGYDVGRSPVLQHTLCNMSEQRSPRISHCICRRIVFREMLLHTALAGGCSRATTRRMQWC